MNTSTRAVELRTRGLRIEANAFLGFFERQRDLYRRYFPPGGAVLDLMSSWVSHLPPEVEYARVVGVGMNAEELAENPFLDEWRVQNLNRQPRLPFGDVGVMRHGIGGHQRLSKLNPRTMAQLRHLPQAPPRGKNGAARTSPPPPGGDRHVGTGVGFVE